jgi:hypothetical protein
LSDFTAPAHSPKAILIAQAMLIAPMLIAQAMLIAPIGRAAGAQGGAAWAYRRY